MSITTHDIQALIELLQRTPMTKPEQLFAGSLVEKLMTLAQTPGEEHHDISANDSGGTSDGPDHEPE